VDHLSGRCIRWCPDGFVGGRRCPSKASTAGYDAPAVSLFKRRVAADDLLRGHLERLGVSPFWLRSALDAIRYCEQGEYFQPVFSVAGPAPARSVIALLRLEPYVQGEIDWNVSPSESPFWVGSVGDLRDELFEETAERFVGLYWSDQNPAVAPAFDGALRSMVAAVEESLTEVGEGPLEGEVWRSIWSLGSGGYVWRVAESDARTSDVNLRADLAKEVEAIVESFPLKEGSYERVLEWASAECVRRILLLGSGSPGGWASGGEFLRRGFRLVNRQVVPESVTIPRDERWYAFSFGVALFDVDECLARRPAPMVGGSEQRGFRRVEPSVRR
jgi:hypothetical protein